MVRKYNNGRPILITEDNWLESTIEHLTGYLIMLEAEVGSKEDEELIERVEALIEYLNRTSVDDDDDDDESSLDG